MATFQQAYDAVAARYSDKLLDSLNPSGFIHEIYQELRRMDAEAVAEKLHPVTNPGKRAKRRNASIASFNRALNGREALHVSGCHETLLETARRHVREGAERVTRQEAMVAELERDNHPDAATFFPREALKTIRSSLDLMKRHLRAIEERKTKPAKARIGSPRVEITGDPQIADSAGVYS